MIRNKALWERVLVVFSVFSFCMSMLGSLPESLRYGYKLEAAADDSLVHRLTAEQTLALYGTTLSGSWYNKNDGLTRSIEFTYMFTTENWRPNDSIQPTNITSVTHGSNAQGNSVRDGMRNSTFLVYIAPITVLNNTYPWVTSNTGNHANVNLNFSLAFTDVTVWDQYFMWTFQTSDVGNYQNAFLTTSFSNFADYKEYSLRRMTSQNLMAYAIMPYYKMDSISGTPDENRLLYNAIIHSNYGLDNNLYSITGQNLTMQSVYPYYLDSSSGIYGDNLNIQYIVLFISCPQLSGYNVWETTANTNVTAGTTVSYQTFPTVDLSGLESGVATMVQQQDEGNYYERVQIDQLNTIIEQLNAIYAAMVQRGEVPVSLTDADSYPTLNNTVLSGVNDAITTYTMAQLPADQIGNGATGLTSFMFFLGDGPWMSMGLFFLGFAIFSWFIFRGRGA